ncbi:glycosyltransferase family 2 protein [Cohnella abietis]|uniref:Beta 1,4 glucosyltransferase n=1 Tax=Cohnella abietis TaxID=2507935 RepID=A0A3T1D3T7_9BACL|nr:glycosyltransferase family 2 protein [Cohnella abietis]BBI32698.1 beta 1,4 glucosyltransferase [Cohnella abietis]
MNDLLRISLCMIVKDEQETLERCLSSVQGIVDEINIIDTGSTDKTKQIAEKFTQRIYDFPWIDDFAAARNFAFAQATEDYILWLDADDILEEKDRLKFITLKQQLNKGTDSVMMPYHLTLDNKGKPGFSLRRNRLVRRDCQFRWEGAVHEVLIVSGTILQSDIAITHHKKEMHTDRNLRIFRQRKQANLTFSPRDLYYYANELRDHDFPEEAAATYEQFLATKQGWIEDCFHACMGMADCYSKLNLEAESVRALLLSLKYGTPRAEMCCRLGLIFLESNRLEQAIYWYNTATRLGRPDQYLGPIVSDYWTWIPHAQLSICYDQMGQWAKAQLHNEMASFHNPEHPGIQNNRKYFGQKIIEMTLSASLSL